MQLFSVYSGSEQFDSLDVLDLKDKRSVNSVHKNQAKGAYGSFWEGERLVLHVASVCHKELGEWQL